MSVKLSPPPNFAKLIDENGKMSQDWLIWFSQMYKRIGGSTAESNDNLSSDSNDLTYITEVHSSQIDDLQYYQQKNINDITLLNEQVNTNINEISTINQNIQTQNQTINNLSSNLDTVSNSLNQLNEIVNKVIKDVNINNITNIMTFTFVDNTTKEIDLSHLA